MCAGQITFKRKKAVPGEPVDDNEKLQYTIKKPKRPPNVRYRRKRDAKVAKINRNKVLY